MNPNGEPSLAAIPSEVCPSALYAGKSWQERKQIVRGYEKLRQRYLAATQQPAPMNRRAKRAAAAQAKTRKPKRKPAPAVFVTEDGQKISFNGEKADTFEAEAVVSFGGETLYQGRATVDRKDRQLNVLVSDAESGEFVEGSAE